MKTQDAPNLLDNAKQKIARQSKELLASQEEVAELKHEADVADRGRLLLVKRAEQAEAENKRLREALEKINELSYRDDVCVGRIAEQALKGE